jgi:hypothetical protein
VGTKDTVNIILSIVVACGALVLFCGVSEGETGKTEVFKIPKQEKAVTKPIQETKQAEAQPQETEPTAEKETEEIPYSYDPTNKVDPFKSFITIREELEEKEASEKPRSFPVDHIGHNPGRGRTLGPGEGFQGRWPCDQSGDTCRKKGWSRHRDPRG